MDIFLSPTYNSICANIKGGYWVCNIKQIDSWFFITAHDLGPTYVSGHTDL